MQLADHRKQRTALECVVHPRVPEQKDRKQNICKLGMHNLKKKIKIKLSSLSYTCSVKCTASKFVHYLPRTENPFSYQSL